MSKQALLDYYADDIAPKKVIYHEIEDGIIAIETRQDVTGLVDLAKNMSEIPPDREFRHVGFVPDYVWNDATRQGWLHDKKAWKKWLNDPDNRAFRTWKGRL
jgi:hypothetical protein